MRVNNKSILSLLIFFLVVLRFIWLLKNSNYLHIDGAYYTGIARFVADGLGLKTNVSLYHKAYPDFPYPTSVAPLWPWLLGQTARITSLEWASKYLSSILWCLIPPCAYLVGRSYFPNVKWKGFSLSGLSFALVFATQRELWNMGGRPYTESLSYLLLLLFMLSVGHCISTSSKKDLLKPSQEFYLFRAMSSRLSSSLPVLGRSGKPSVDKTLHPASHLLKVVLFGFLLGFLSLLLLMARGQFIVFVIVLPVFCVVTLVLLLLPNLALYLRINTSSVSAYKMLALCFGYLIAVTVGWWLWLSILSPYFADMSLMAPIRFDQNRASWVLSDHQVLKSTSGLWAYIVDRAQGFYVAFNWGAGHAYRRAYYVLPYLVLVLPVLFWIKDRDCDQSTRQWTLEQLFFFIVACAGFFSIHTVHKVYEAAWHFDRRQGLTSIFFFLFVLILFLRHKDKFVRGIGLGFLIVTVVMGASHIFETIQRPSTTTDDRRLAPLITYMNTHAETIERYAVTGHVSQRLSPHIDQRIGLHWVHRKTTLKDLAMMQCELGVTHLVTTSSLKGYQFSLKKLQDKLGQPVKKHKRFKIFELDMPCIK